MRIFVFALPFEAAGFQKPSPSDEIWVLGCAGKFAGPAFEERLETVKQPDLVISAGLAGALKTGLCVGDLLVCENSDAKILEAAHRKSWKIGRIETIDAIAGSRAEKSALAAKSGADACDMENARIAAICRRIGIPFAGLRAISDPLGFEMPVPAGILADPANGKTNLAALAANLIRHPGRIPSFFQMVADASRAKKCLHAALGAGAIERFK